MKKVKKIIFGYLPGFVLGVITAISISVIAATYFPSNQTTYDNSVSGLESTDVQGAIDELYGVCTTPSTAGEWVLDNTDIVTSGDGLYKDDYENGRYFYKGKVPNNYIVFNNEMWRIISVEKDNSLKIIKDGSIGTKAWNTSGNADWKEPSSLNLYLNSEYLTNIKINSDKIIPHNFPIGKVTLDNNNLAEQIANENSVYWHGKIALITVSEYLRANSNLTQCETIKLYNENHECIQTNWIYDIIPLGYSMWTISIYNNPISIISFDNILDRFGASYDGINVIPVMYLNSNIILSGIGTEQDPFQITN